jgi:hypothetical protein
MSVECLIAFLYIKWQELDFEMANLRWPSQVEEDSWDEDLRKWSNVGKKFDKVSEFLTIQTFDDFVLNNSFSKGVLQLHPGLSGNISPKKWFQDELFKKRNRIVHRGEVDFNQSEAAACVDIGRTLLQIFKEMDDIRYKIKFP